MLAESQTLEANKNKSKTCPTTAPSKKVQPEIIELYDSAEEEAEHVVSSYHIPQAIP